MDPSVRPSGHAASQATKRGNYDSVGLTYVLSVRPDRALFSLSVAEKWTRPLKTEARTSYLLPPRPAAPCLPACHIKQLSFLTSFAPRSAGRSTAS